MIEVECALHSWQAELAWTRQTVTEIRTGTLPWPGAPVERGQNHNRSQNGD